MRNLENEFAKRNIDFKKLIKYGFVKSDGEYVFTTKIMDGEFEIEIVISEKEQFSKVIDVENECEYALVDVEDSVGNFVGTVRYEYEHVLNEIIDKCTVKENFKSHQAKEIIEYVNQKYGDELEFLWEKYDDCAIWRNKQNEKWYATLMIIPESKVKNGGTEKEIEIIDLKCDKDMVGEIVDNNSIFPGYHMNKKSWITVILDYSNSTERVCELIDNSYELSLGGKNGRQLR